MYDFKTVTYSNVHFHCLRLATFSIVSAIRASSIAMLCLPACLFTCSWRNDDDDDDDDIIVNDDDCIGLTSRFVVRFSIFLIVFEWRLSICPS